MQRFGVVPRLERRLAESNVMAGLQGRIGLLSRRAGAVFASELGEQRLGRAPHKLADPVRQMKDCPVLPWWSVVHAPVVIQTAPRRCGLADLLTVQADQNSPAQRTGCSNGVSSSGAAPGTG